jgi:hypothetical protein
MAFKMECVVIFSLAKKGVCGILRDTIVISRIKGEEKHMAWNDNKDQGPWGKKRPGSTKDPQISTTF